jgi:hypothetical protein
MRASGSSPSCGLGLPSPIEAAHKTRFPCHETHTQGDDYVFTSRTP